MNFELHNLKKSKSLGDLKANLNTSNVCFWEYNQIKKQENSFIDPMETHSEDFYIDENLTVGTKFTGVEINAQVISALEYKMNKLNDLLQEQHILLKHLKGDLDIPKVPPFINAAFPQSYDSFELLEQLIKDLDVSETKERTNHKARSLLDAIELKHTQRLDHHIKEVLSKFLQSDDLKKHVTAATVESLKDVIGRYFSEVFPNTYLSILQHSYRRLFKHVTKCIENAFTELEQSVSLLYKSVYKTSRTLRFTMENHQVLLESNRPSKNVLESLDRAMEEVLHKELENWRQKLLKVFVADSSKSPLTLDESELRELSSYMPPSPPQPADPEQSIIDQLMKSAKIMKQISEGNANKSFEEALSSSDLSLVMAACRAANPVQLFTEPCALQQSVLLSLVQQLATDMVHDTQLKCRYLEDAIINLKPTDPATRAHLPLVVEEVRKHLSKFLQSYPSHVASRRITLIIMAANNLVK